MNVKDENYFTEIETQLLDYTQIIYKELLDSNLDPVIKDQHLEKIVLDRIIVIKIAALRNGYFLDEDKAIFEDEKLNIALTEEILNEAMQHIKEIHRLYFLMMQEIMN